MQADDLRRRIATEREGRWYPADLRNAIVEYGVEQKARGALWREIAAELGVHEHTIRWWKKEARKAGGTVARVPRENAAGSVARVEIIADEPAAAREVVVEFGALRVRGLDLAGVAELLRRLS